MSGEVIHDVVTGAGSRYMFMLTTESKQLVYPQPTFRLLPNLPQVCGGTTAWVLDVDQELYILGCLCHHDPNDLLQDVMRGRVKPIPMQALNSVVGGPQ